MNARVILWIFIGLAIGVCLHLMRKPINPSNQLAGMSKFDALLDEGKPVYGVADHEEVKPRFLRSRPQPAPNPEVHDPETFEPENFQAHTNLEHNAEVKPSPTPKVLGKADLKKAKEDEEKKKKELARKKRQQKLKKQREEAARRSLEEQLEEEERMQAEMEEEERRRLESSREIENVAVVAPFPTPTPTPIPGGGSSGEVVPQSASEWEEKLLKEPNAARTAQFVRYFLSGKIKSDVFYSVMKQMIEDNRPRMRELAVKSISEIFNADSFTLLAQTLHNETDLEIKARIETAIQTYSLPSNVRHLAGVLDNEADPHVTYLAMEVLKQSIETHLRGHTGMPPNDAEPREPATSSLARIYTSFMSTLAELSQKSPDPQIRQNAAQVLNELQFLLAAI